MSSLRANGMHFHLLRSGRGPPLLLLHGLGSGSEEWAPQIAAFDTRFDVIAFDARGHGRSDKPHGPYSIGQMRRDASAVLHALGTGPAHVAGFSMGGMVAFDLAVHCPEQVLSLSIVNSGPEFLLHGLAARRWLWSRLWLVRLRGMRIMGERLAADTLPGAGPERAALREAVAARWADNDPRAYRAALRALPGWSVADRLESIRVPCNIITADADYTPVAYKRHYAARLAQARLRVIPRTRHLLPFEAPEALTRALALMLDTFVPGSPGADSATG